MTDEPFEHRCTIVLPQAQIFAATDVLNLMALAVRNRDNDGPPESARPPIFRWDSVPRVYNPSDFSAHYNDAEPQRHTTDQSHEIPKQEEQLLIWDDRAEKIKSSLLKELYQSVRNGHLNLWSLFCDTAKEPPSDLGNIDFWIKTSNIYRSDLIKFCHSQKIKVEIDQTSPHPGKQNTFNQHTDEPRNDTYQAETRPPHWADYKELAHAFPAVEKTDSETRKWFQQGSSDHKRARGFKEAYVKGTGKRGSGNRSQFNIFAIANYLLKRDFLKEQAVARGLRKHLGAALEDYKYEYDDLFSSGEKSS